MDYKIGSPPNVPGSNASFGVSGNCCYSAPWSLDAVAKDYIGPSSIGSLSCGLTYPTPLLCLNGLFIGSIWLPF